MENNKLLPCPFCGCEVKIEYRKMTDEYYILHENFKCILKKQFFESYDKEKLIKEWNKRK